jgi:hypothetical protein
MTQPPAHNSDSGRRPPEYIIVAWASQQLRDRIQHAGLSLAEALRAADPPEPGPQPDPEAEP